jgi:hypothetical protein
VQQQAAALCQSRNLHPRSTLGAHGDGDYRQLTSPVISEDNFAHVIVETEHIHVNT